MVRGTRAGHPLLGVRSTLALLAELALVATLPAGTALAAADGVGRWSAPFDLDVIAAHAAVLPNGKVLLFSYPDETPGSRARLFDPKTRATTRVDVRDAQDLFCSGHSLLPDGRLFVAGGTVPGAEVGAGIAMTNLFDGTDERWRDGPPMAFERYYPSTIELPSGRILILAGQDGLQRPVERMEVYDPHGDRVESLPTRSSKLFALYPRLHVLPDGRVFSAGHERESFAFSWRTKRWEHVADMRASGRSEGTSVLLPLGPGAPPRVLAVGGADGLLPTASAEIIDFSKPDPSWRPTASMESAREFHNAVLLADGTVLVVGGGQTGVGGLLTVPEYGAELFDPETETWATMATQAVARAYHSTAVLLPDGRVLSAGADSLQDRVVGRDPYTGELFSPPYLFDGDGPARRPVIGALSRTSIGYGERFTIETSDAASVTRVALVRPGTATHGTNFDQRYVQLVISRAESSLVAIAPGYPNLAPPGWYMLFILNGEGVPSVARWVRLR
jgi:hypothetical protein